MNFSEKLRKERTKAGLTQEQLALKLGVSCRTLQNYESGTVYPKNRKLYSRLAEFFHTDVNYWLTETPDTQTTEKSMRQENVNELASQVSSLFVSKDFSDEDLDSFMRTVQEAYWAAKDKNKNILK